MPIGRETVITYAYCNMGDSVVLGIWVVEVVCCDEVVVGGGEVDVAVVSGGGVVSSTVVSSTVVSSIVVSSTVVSASGSGKIHTSGAVGSTIIPCGQIHEHDASIQTASDGRVNGSHAEHMVSDICVQLAV
jgi:hypothetical protein